MTTAEVRNQTIKAQLIYLSFFDNVRNFNAESYAKLFAVSPDDKALIDAINSTYSLEINYEDFMRSYTFVMNATINQYMFSDSKSKNAADLAAWAENAYLSGWGYKDGSFGDRDESDRIRYADSAGLILGYLRYDPEQKSFSNEPSSLHFTSKGGLDKMPDWGWRSGFCIERIRLCYQRYCQQWHMECMEFHQRCDIQYEHFF